MAKVQSFADKMNKKSGADAAKVIKVVFSYQSPDTGNWRFSEKFVKVMPGENESQKIETEIKSGRALLQKN
jgi:hypothetical protein